MAREPETHRLQPDPPEGDRGVIERELARQEKTEKADKAPDGPARGDRDGGA